MISPAPVTPPVAAGSAVERALQEFFGPPAAAATPEFAVIALAVAVALGLVVSLTYRLTNRELVHSQKLMQGLVIVAGAVCTIMLVVRDHLAVAFALVGVLSVLRLRAVVGNSREFIFILVSLGAGLGAGSANNDPTHLAIIGAGTIAVCFVAWLLYAVNYGRYAGATFNVTIRAPAKSLDAIRSVLKVWCKKSRSAGYCKFGDPKEAFLFEVLMRPGHEPVGLIAALRSECEATEVTMLPWQRDGAVGDLT